MSDSQNIVIGPDGSNLLGFLCSIGTLATLHRALQTKSIHLSWFFKAGWRPSLFINAEKIAEGDCEILFSELTNRRTFRRFLLRRTELAKNKTTRRKAGVYDNLHDVDPTDFRDLAISARRTASAEKRWLVDWIVGLGSDLSKDESEIQDTAFRTLNGAGRQNFFTTILQLAGRQRSGDRGATLNHIRRTLFAQWDYEDEKGGMRWDSAEDRQHALRWRDPTDSSAPIRTERGANRLAIEALPLFPTAPTSRGLRTCGFSRYGGRDYFSWPVWRCRLSLDAARTLLSHPELTELEPRRAILAPLGVEEVFRCERIQQGRQRNFSIALPILR